MAGFHTGKSISSKFPFTGTRTLPPIISTSDRKFLDSLQNYIKYEKKCLKLPSEEPDEQRYNIYSSVFDKVIEHAEGYKTVLSAIKKEYDDFISAVKRSENEARRAQRRLRAKAGEPTVLMQYNTRAAQLQDRIAIIQENTAQLHAQLRRLRECKERRPSQQNSKGLPPSGAIPGLTFQESVNLATLQLYLERVERRRADLQRKKQSQYVSKQVMAHLESKLQRARDQRDQLAAENLQLELRHRKMEFLCKAFRSWEKSERAVPLSEFLPSILEKTSRFKVHDTDDHDVTAGASEEDAAADAEESKLLSDCVERFTQLFEGREYQGAAVHAARAPRGILRNLETMDRFKGVQRYEGAVPPALLYFQALMAAVPAGQRLPGAELAVEGVRTALQNCGLEQVVHWVTQHRLMFSEALGDVLSAHAHEDAAAADACLALAQEVYGTCELHSKAAVCMTRRGLVSWAVDFIYSSKAFTADDCLYVVQSCPSVALLQALTQAVPGRPAALSLGHAARSLMGTHSEELVHQLLQRMQACGDLERAILEDHAHTEEGWGEVAARCRAKGWWQLAQAVSSALTSLRRDTGLSQGIESVRPTEHGS